MRNKDLEKDWDPSFFLVLREDLTKFTERFTEMFNKTIFESHTVIGVTETLVYCSWEEANEWIVLASVSGCGTGKVPVKRFQFKCTSCRMKVLLFLIWFYSVAPRWIQPNLSCQSYVVISAQNAKLSFFILSFISRKEERASTFCWECQSGKSMETDAQNPKGSRIRDQCHNAPAQQIASSKSPLLYINREVTLHLLPMMTPLSCNLCECVLMGLHFLADIFTINIGKVGM